MKIDSTKWINTLPSSKFKSSENKEMDASRWVNTLPKKNISTLCESIRNTLQSSITAHGTTVVNFSYLNGISGKFSNQLQVFGKAGQPCFVCTTKIIKKKVAGRGTHYCPKCQKKKY